MGVEVAEVGFDLPDSISAVRGGVRMEAARAAGDLPDSQAEIVREIFGAIRAYAGLADELRRLIKEMLEKIPTNLPETYSGPLGDGAYLLTIERSPKPAYTHRIVLQTATGAEKIASVELDNVGRKKGIVTLNVGKLDPSSAPTARVRLTFDGTDASDRRMIVEASGLLAAPNPEDDWALGGLKIDARKQGSTILLSGNSHHPYAGMNDDFMPDAARNYVFVAKIDEAADRATVKLAVPTDDVRAGSTFFTEHSVGAVFTAAVHDWAKKRPASEVNFAAVAALPKVAAALTQPPPKSNSEMTQAQFVDLLRAVRQVDPSNKDVANILFVTSLDNPVYFNNQGYVSNGDTAGLSGYPSPSDLERISVIEPTEVRDLKVEFQAAVPRAIAEDSGL